MAFDAATFAVEVFVEVVWFFGGGGVFPEVGAGGGAGFLGEIASFLVGVPAGEVLAGEADHFCRLQK